MSDLLAIVNVILNLLLLALGWHMRGKILEHLERAEKAQLETLTLTKATREYSRSAHVQRRETAEAVEQVPQKTAERVVEAIKSDGVP